MADPQQGTDAKKIFAQSKEIGDLTFTFSVYARGSMKKLNGLADEAHIELVKFTFDTARSVNDVLLPKLTAQLIQMNAPKPAGS